MKHPIPMTKKYAVDLFGGTLALATALQYKGRQTINAWPDVLSHRDSLMVIGAALMREQAQAEKPPAPPPRRLRVRLVRGRAA